MSVKKSIEANIKPTKYEKGRPIYSRADGERIALVMIGAKQYFTMRAKNMSIDTENAIELTNDVSERFSKSLDGLIKTERRFSEETKRASGSVRDAANKLADGLLKVEKAANFDRLEIYVSLLERAAKAMTVLSDLEKSGKLEKIAAAIK